MSSSILIGNTMNSNTIKMIAPMLASVIKEGSVCTADEWKELTDSINKHL